MNIFKWSGCFFILFVTHINIYAQTIQTPVYENSHFRYGLKTEPLTNSITTNNVTSGNAIATGYTSEVMLPAELNISKRKIVGALFNLKVNLGDDYTYGPVGTVLDFKYKITFTIKGFNGATEVTNVFDDAAYDLIIENGKPEAVFSKDFTQFTDLATNSVDASDFLFQRFSIGSVTITPLITAASASSTQAEMLAKIANKIRFELSYDIEYGLDVPSTSVKPVLASLKTTKQIFKQITFTWDNLGYEFPNYEFQLLRLYNNQQATAVSETDITTDIDWSKALKIETQSSATSLTLTIPEGTGFYVWRVRPIGTFYDGGIANDLNFSDNGWSTNPGDVAGLHIQFSDTEGILYNGGDSDAYFYYEDSEANKNWIYSRTFTEENKVSENVVFATPLQQVRQTQSYRASKDNTLITQTIPDNTGRPALTTMGVPVPGKLGEYKEKVVQKQGSGKVYTADDYDDASNYRNPSKVEQTNSPLSYYSNQNPDLNIPDAEGYPFQRTLFHNDGSARVLEQSGVGKTHMIGDADDSGKTIKTLYGTASDEEMIALFGDEAPNAESVLTTYTIDQNNTASISYMSKEGKVIATGLSFQDGEGNVLDPLKDEGTAASKKTVSDVMKQNVTTQNGFISSKRIALLQASPLNITYKVKCQDLENNCLDLTLDCKYKVRVIIHNVENPDATIVLPEQELGASVACTPDANGIEYKMVSWPQQTLSPGTYVIEKILQAGEPTIAVESKTKAEKQIMPLINKITGWLEGVDCEAELQDFYTKLSDIKNDVNNAFVGGSACDAACVVNKYGLGDFILTPEHKIDIYNNTAGNPMRLEISSPCCGVMSVSVAYVPPFRCPAVVEQVDANHNGVFDVNPNFIDDPGATEYFPDFEGYAWSLLKECVGPNFNRDIFYQKYMLGWSTPGDFNKMIYHMLSDKYNAQGVESVEGTQNASGSAPVASKDDCGNPIVNTGILCDANTNNCTQYTCSQLIDCWTQQIVLLRSSMCGDGTLSGSANVSNSTDDAAGETAGEGKTHDNHFNDNFSDVKLSRRKKRKIKKKIAQAMRDLSATQANVEYTGFLVKDFLDCTGYKFAKILTTEDPEPLPGDVSGNTAYNVPFTGVGTVTPPCPSGGCKKWPYKPTLVNGVPSWPEIVVVPAAGAVEAKRLKHYFPHVKDPLYAFKYFEYPEAERIREIEVLTCYSDPNDCYKTDALGAIVRDGNGRPIKIPCCFVKKSDGTYDESFCETAVSATGGNGNYSPSGNNNYTLKYYTKEFCDLGKVVCPYTASGWSAGQRYTFYNMLNTYRPQNFDGEDGSEIIESELDYTSPMTLYNESTNPFGITPEEIADWNTWTGSTNTEYPSVVKFDMMKMTKDCEGKCDERRSEFRNKLLLSFTQNGYVIGGCKGTDTDNVVPEEDIDLLVDEIIEQCKSQCTISTYQLETRSCRKINTDAITLGPTNTNIEVEYGVGGCAGNCPSNVVGCQDASCDPSTGKCPATSTTLSRCEQKKWKQVMTWDFEIDMPSKLDADGNSAPDGSRKFTCIANPNMADYTELPNSINTGVPDINNFKTAKTVSPAVEINLSLPAKN